MAKKKVVKNFIIPLVVYPFDVMVSIGESDDQLSKRLYKLGVSEETELYSINGRAGRTVQFKSGQLLIRLPEVPKTCEQYGTLAHEIFHCVEFLMAHIQMRLSYDSDEAFAYLIGYLTTQIYKKL